MRGAWQLVAKGGTWGGTGGRARGLRHPSILPQCMHPSAQTHTHTHPQQVISDVSAPKMRFDLFIKTSLSAISSASGGLAAFTADLKEAVALAFQVWN